MSFTIRFRNYFSSNYKKICYFFFQYWYTVEKRGVELDDLHVCTNFIFDYMRLEWLDNDWDVEELEFWCLAMDQMPDELDPNNFVISQYSYLITLKNYYLNNG